MNWNLFGSSRDGDAFLAGRKDLQLNVLLLTLHSVCRDKATHRFCETGSFHRVAAEDQWGSLATRKKYVVSAVANLQRTRSLMLKHYKQLLATKGTV